MFFNLPNLKGSTLVPKFDKIGVSSRRISNFLNPAPIQHNDPTNVPTLTLEIVQQMIISTFSALGISNNKFVFYTKLCSDGSIDHYKTRLVVLENKQEYGLNYDETFALVAMMTIVHTVLALAASQS
ncbi:hypothetical protein CR513_57530, partial [Mucuna pruriens]